MQDYLREIEGRLARKNERQNTILYRLAKRKADEKRLSSLGLRSVPSNPLDTSDVNVVKYVLFKIGQEIGDKVARLRNPELVSIESQGEVAVRAKNDEVNQLISRKNIWERRLATLKGETYRRPVTRKIYFGCAAELPEAKANEGGETALPEEGGERDWDSRSHGSSLSDDDAPNPSVLYRDGIADRVSEKFLRSIEAEAELKLRAEHSRDGETQPVLGQLDKATFIADVVLPSEEEFRVRHLERKKHALRERIYALKN